MIPSEKQKPSLSRIPDADEDLDDLDDVLDQFDTQVNLAETPKKLVSPPPPPPSAATRATFSGRPRTNTRVDAPPKPAPGGLGAGLDPTTEIDDEDQLSAEFTRALEKGMENLMREISGGSSAGEHNNGESADGGSGMTDEQAAKALQAAWEAMLVEGMDEMGKGNEGSSALGGNDEKGKGDANGNVSGSDFQSKIKQAVNKLRETESNLQADSKPKSDVDPGNLPPDLLDSLISSLVGGNGAESEEELAGLLEGMMGQLMSKEILYEPLKELETSFPPYLANPPAPISQEDKKRYENQLVCLRKILAVFDKPSYNDEDEETKREVADLMAEMQTYGTPPTEIMGQVPPGFSDGSCVVA